MNIAMTVLIEKEMLFSMFDGNYSLMIDHSAVRSRFVLLIATIITAVVTFRVTGIIMILGLIIAPAFIASFLTRRLWLLIVLASFAGISSSLAGYAAAHILEITISASIVSALGVILLITAIFAPKSGILARRAVKKQAEIERAIALISAHLLRQEGNRKKAEVDFSRKFNWSRDFINTVFNKAENYIISGENGYMLTERGRALARDVAASCKLPDRLP
jgi:hypothetical protein